MVSQRHIKCADCRTEGKQNTLAHVSCLTHPLIIIRRHIYSLGEENGKGKERQKEGESEGKRQEHTEKLYFPLLLYVSLRFSPLLDLAMEAKADEQS